MLKSHWTKELICLNSNDSDNILFLKLIYKWLIMIFDIQVFVYYVLPFAK